MKRGFLVESPVGPLGFDGDDTAVTQLVWGRSGNLSSAALQDQVAGELSDYFAGDRKRFSIPIRVGETEFQRRFLAELQAIPYGETRQYGDLSKSLGVSAQAIGQACGANPIAILIPCHRVLAANGLGGYSGAGGIEAKVALLKLEGAAGLLI